MSQHEPPLRACPQCGHPGLEQPLCPMCAWQPEPPPVHTHLLCGEQVITVRWRMVGGVPVGDPIANRSFWDWVERRSAW